MLYLCEDVGVASCSSHILCSYNLTLGSISSVYPYSANGQDILLIVSSSSYRPIPSSFVTSSHSGMILDIKVPTPSHPLCALGLGKGAACPTHDGLRLCALCIFLSIDPFSVSSSPVAPALPCRLALGRDAYTGMVYSDLFLKHYTLAARPSALQLIGQH
jgi:hypothetical protein